MAKPKKPLNAGLQFERDFIAFARQAGFQTEKLSTPTPPMRPCTCGATPRSAFTTKRPYDVLLTQAIFSTEGLLPNQGPAGHHVVAVECKSAGKTPRLPLERIQEHQIKGLQERAKAGWLAGLAIDLPKPGGADEREWWWLPAHRIEVLTAACLAAGRASATWKELREAGGQHISQSAAGFALSLGVY